MSVSVVCEHFSSTPAIEDSVERSLEAITHKMPRIQDVAVYLSKSGHDFFLATMRVHAAGKTLVSHATNPDLYTAIDSATRKLVKQFRHVKTERLKRRREARLAKQQLTQLEIY